MKTGKNIKGEIEAQKKIVSRLKGEIFGVDKTSSSRYIRDFQSEYASYRRIVPAEKVISSAMKSDIVYFGDYHPLSASQQWALWLMKEMTERGAGVVLALEMLYEYQQESLDRWMKGTYTEEEFLGVISYESEWGFDWENYRKFFESARDPFVPIFGIDYEPRDQLRFIRQRDRMIAQKIASIRSFFPGHAILVVIGESHLASSHLPLEVRRICGDEIRDTIIVQNMDAIFWKLMRRDGARPHSVMVDSDRYCVFTASPVMKYQSYRDMIQLWSDQSFSETALESLTEMVDDIFLFLRGGAEDLQVTVRRGFKEPVGDVFPEICSGKTYASFATVLRSRQISDDGLLALKEELRRAGMNYFPSMNLFMVMKFNQACAAREAARFVVYAMRDEIGRKNRVVRSEEDRFFAYVFEEALAWVGAKMVDPLIDPQVKGDILDCIDGRGRVTGPVGSFSMGETRDAAALLKYFLKRKRSGAGKLRATSKLRKLYSLGIRKRLLVIRALGRTLGNEIYRGFHGGTVSREDLISIFAERFCGPVPGSAVYIEWARRVSED